MTDRPVNHKLVVLGVIGLALTAAAAADNKFAEDIKRACRVKVKVKVVRYLI